MECERTLPLTVVVGCHLPPCRVDGCCVTGVMARLRAPVTIFRQGNGGAWAAASFAWLGGRGGVYLLENLVFSERHLVPGKL